jgi:hypothetical protein
VDDGFVVFKLDNLAVKGGPQSGPSSVAPEPEWELGSCAQAQLVHLGVGGVLQVLGGCTRAHPPDVAPELVRELETRSRAFICICNRCSLGGFVGAVLVVVLMWARSWARASWPM